MERIDIDELQHSLDDVINLVNGGKLRVLLEDGGTARCAFVSLSDLELLEHIAGDPKRLPGRRGADDLRGSLNRGSLDGALAAGRVILQQEGRDVAALVTMQDIDSLQLIDERIDLEVARRMLEGEMPLDSRE